MSLADALSESRRRTRARYCGVGKLLQTMPVLDKDALLDALADPLYSSSDIARALQDEGFDISNYTLRYHRRGDCSCARNDA